MDLRVGQDDANFADVFDGEFGFAVGAGDPADGAGEMIAFEFFHVGYFKRLEEEIVEAHQSQGVGDVEAQDEGADEVGRFLNRPYVFCFLASFDFDIPSLKIESNLQLQMLHDWRINFLPTLLQRRVTIVGNWNLSETINSIF